MLSCLLLRQQRETTKNLLICDAWWEYFHIDKNNRSINTKIFCKSSILNTQIYNLVSLLQIKWFLLGDTIISSKTDLHNDSCMEKRSYGKVKNKKTMLKILPSIWILYLRQHSSILWCFCRLKFEKKLTKNNTFFNFIFRSKRIVHTAEKDQIKYFSMWFSMCKLLLEFPAAVINYFFTI